MLPFFSFDSQMIFLHYSASAFLLLPILASHVPWRINYLGYPLRRFRIQRTTKQLNEDVNHQSDHLKSPPSTMDEIWDIDVALSWLERKFRY